MKTTFKITLTEKQAFALLACCDAAHGLLQNFLRHDDWDSEMSKTEREKHLRTDRFYARTYKMLGAKLRRNG